MCGQQFFSSVLILIYFYFFDRGEKKMDEIFFYKQKLREKNMHIYHEYPNSIYIIWNWPTTESAVCGDSVSIKTHRP